MAKHNKHSIYVLELKMSDKIEYDEHNTLYLPWKFIDERRLLKIPVLIREDEPMHSKSLGVRKGFESILRFRIDSDDQEYVNEVSQFLMHHRYILMQQTEEGMRVMASPYHTHPVEVRVHGARPSQTNMVARSFPLLRPYYYARFDKPLEGVTI